MDDRLPVDSRSSSSQPRRTVPTMTLTFANACVSHGSPTYQGLSSEPMDVGASGEVVDLRRWSR